MRNKINNSTHYSGGGLGLSGVLTVVFVVLKLVGVINWSWVWVLSPLWISAIITVVLIIILLIVYLICLSEWDTKDKKRKRDKWKF